MGRGQDKQDEWGARQRGAVLYGRRRGRRRQASARPPTSVQRIARGKQILAQTTDAQFLEIAEELATDVGDLLAHLRHFGDRYGFALDDIDPHERAHCVTSADGLCDYWLTPLADHELGSCERCADYAERAVGLLVGQEAIVMARQDPAGGKGLRVGVAELLGDLEILCRDAGIDFAALVVASEDTYRGDHEDGPAVRPLA